MSGLGQVCLLLAFVASGYAAFACIAGTSLGHRAVARSGVVAALLSLVSVTVVVVILAVALLRKDFGFLYVAQYCNPLLPWHYCLSAFWVGQAGSLLLWTWFLAVMAVVFLWRSAQADDLLRQTAFGVLMGYVCFLAAMMIFAADPVEPNVTQHTSGGLSPVLQHPAMLIDPPVVSRGYAGWGIPFALAVAALGVGRLDGRWLRLARPWALAAWSVQGLGILLGGYWAYEVLGWGGYWSWDPVENGSLLPWLAGTAMIHGLLAWQHSGTAKKSTLLLAVAVFGLCNFATFLTRSGIFSSLHEFSQSPIGWMFLGVMLALGAGGIGLVVARRRQLAPLRPLGGLMSRETLIVLSMFVLVLLTVVILLGTLSIPLSNYVFRKSITLGQAYYNNLLMPAAAFLLTTMALAPLVRWSAPPTAAQKRAIWTCAGVALGAALLAGLCGVRHPMGFVVAGISGLCGSAIVAAVVLDLIPRTGGGLGLLVVRLAAQRRAYAAFVIHLGLVRLAIGVTGSSLGTRRENVTLAGGETLHWAGRDVRYVGLQKQDLPDKFVARAELEVREAGGSVYGLFPAQNFFHAHQQWQTEVAVHSAWSADFYVILQGHQAQTRVNLTLIENPLVRWMWFSGWVTGIAALVGLWPGRRRGPATWPAAAQEPGLATRAGRCGPGGGGAPVKVTPPAIACRGLSKEFDGRRVLRNVDLEIAAGEAVALTGENGAGKTTLLRCLAGLIAPTDGSVSWFGEKVARQPAARRLIGVVAHDSLLYPQLTARENLVFAARMYGLAAPGRRADELLETIGLADDAQRPAGVLSSGMTRRLSIARALVHQPPILYFDEPFSGLDHFWSGWLLDMLMTLRRQGTTLCLVLHEPEKIQRLADRVLMLRKGRVAELPQADSLRRAA